MKLLSLITAQSVVFISNTAVAKPIISLACNDINGVVSYPMATGGKSINGFESDGFAGGRIVLDAQKNLAGDIVGSVVFKDATGELSTKKQRGRKFSH